jgi:hypothetical protein
MRSCRSDAGIMQEDIELGQCLLSTSCAGEVTGGMWDCCLQDRMRSCRSSGEVRYVYMSCTGVCLKNSYAQG